MKRIYVDTEYMYEAMFYERRMPKYNDKKQIIQIAAVLFDHDKGAEIESLDILVKPIFHNNLPDFFIELTGINNKMIENKAIPFPKALKQFVKFCKNYPIWTFNNDYNVFLQNLKFHSIANPFKCPFKKVKPLLKNFGINPKEYSSGTLYKAVGLNLKGHIHYALHDVRSMSQSMHSLEKNANLPFLL
ncbi:MAG: 3'-5' exonuclease [Patescibacteria group bacterium]|jgi:inhibitor of KinA sporulation pathway (predicted exonuclease)